MSKNDDIAENEQKGDNEEKIEESNIDDWMIRPCHIYKEEYSDCTSLRARFNQYFIFGDYIDCSQWNKDYKSCEKWVTTKDNVAHDKLVASETNRRLTRFKAHYANNVWKKRDKPPEDWNKPLPQWLQDREANSYLDLRSKEMKEKDIKPKEQQLCTIS